MHNYTEKIEGKQQLKEGKLGVKLAYFVAGGIFEANSGCNSYKKSGRIGEELNSWINSGSLCNSTSGAHFFCSEHEI